MSVETEFGQVNIPVLIRMYENQRRHLIERNEWRKTEAGKEYNRKKAKEFYERNKEQILAKRKALYEVKGDEINAKNLAYYHRKKNETTEA